MDSLFPEVFGFALDGLVIFSGITLIQLHIARKEKEDRMNEQLSILRGLAGAYLASCRLIAAQHGEPMPSDQLTRFDHESIALLSERIRKIKIDDQKESVIELVAYVRDNKDILHSALIIASQISSSAVISWNYFLVSINQINSNESNFGPSISNSIEALRLLETKNG